MKILGVACERATYAGESRFSRSGPRQTTIRVDLRNPWLDRIPLVRVFRGLSSIQREPSRSFRSGLRSVSVIRAIC